MTRQIVLKNRALKHSSSVRVNKISSQKDSGEIHMASNLDVFRQTNLATEPSEYVVQRDQLRLAEIELMHHQEKVAEMRRRLPQGPEIQNYVFEEGPADLNAGDSPVRTVRMSQLFTAADGALMIYHFMFGKKN